MANLPVVTDDTFEKKVLKSAKPVLVELGAEWCHPCKQLNPIVEELAEEWDDRVKVFTLDIDSNVNTTMQLGVMSVPTLILFLQGKQVERITGYQPKERILKKLEPHLKL